MSEMQSGKAILALLLLQLTMGVAVAFSTAPFWLKVGLILTTLIATRLLIDVIKTARLTR